MKQFIVQQNKVTGYYEIYDCFYEKVHSKFEWPADAKQKCDELNKREGY